MGGEGAVPSMAFTMEVSCSSSIVPMPRSMSLTAAVRFAIYFMIARIASLGGPVSEAAAASLGLASVLLGRPDMVVLLTLRDASLYLDR